jgi:hypothetical protein
MTGALAWQATVIKKIFLCPWEEIARGLIFLAPGSPPPLVSLCPLLSVLRCSSALRKSCIIYLGAAAKIWSYSETPKVQPVI